MFFAYFLKKDMKHNAFYIIKCFYNLFFKNELEYLMFVISCCCVYKICIYFKFGPLWHYRKS